MYRKATARVKINSSQATGVFKCQKGVRQGCNLCPLLFISGLEVELAKNEAGVSPWGETALDTPMFADDIILLSASANGLNKQIGTHEEFCSQWNLRINTENLKSVFLEKENITILNAREYTLRM